MFLLTWIIVEQLNSEDFEKFKKDKFKLEKHLAPVSARPPDMDQNSNYPLEETQHPNTALISERPKQKSIENVPSEEDTAQESHYIMKRIIDGNQVDVGGYQVNSGIGMGESSIPRIHHEEITGNTIHGRAMQVNAPMDIEALKLLLAAQSAR